MVDLEAGFIDETAVHHRLDDGFCRSSSASFIDVLGLRG